MWQELREIGRDLSGDVRIAIVRGEGRAFSSGLDLNAVSDTPDAAATDLRSRRSSQAEATSDFSIPQLARRDPAEAAEVIALFQQAFSWLRRPDLVSIAAVRGHAIGAGFQLALACDLRVLTENAQFAMAEVALGLVPDLGGTKRLVELVGYGRALDICVTGRRIDASEALQIGLATTVVPDGEMDKTVADLTGQILAAQRDVVVEIKALLLAAGSRTFSEQEAAERAAQVRRIRDLVGLGE